MPCKRINKNSFFFFLNWLCTEMPALPSCDLYYSQWWKYNLGVLECFHFLPLYTYVTTFQRDILLFTTFYNYLVEILLLVMEYQAVFILLLPVHIQQRSTGDIQCCVSLMESSSCLTSAECTGSFHISEDTWRF